MPKRALKTAIVSTQQGLCALTETPLSPDLALMDTDRILPKASGGIYTRDNTRVVDPVAHLDRHGNLRERETSLDELKSHFDDRRQVMKLLLKENNQILAYERRVDKPHPKTLAFLRAHLEPVQARLAEIDKDIVKAVRGYDDPLAKAALAVPGMGPITVTALAVYVDFFKKVCSTCHKPLADDAIVSKPKLKRKPLEGIDSESGRARKPSHQNDPYRHYCTCPPATVTLVDAASTPSSLWKYVGLHAPSYDRYVDGETSGGNKTLRTVLWNTANVMVKMGDNCAYREVYDRTKQRLALSEKITKSRNTQGRLIECAWKDTKPSHRHGAALRAIMKHVLADYWMVGRTLYGMSTRPLYVQEVLGHTHIISPRERGWKY